jgi:hypothetical protein
MSYKFIDNNKKILYLVLPGASNNTSTGLIKTIVDKLEILQKNVLAVNYPFQDRNEEKSSGEQLLEEQHEVVLAINEVSKNIKWERIIIIAKSLGAVVSTRLLKTIQEKYSTNIELHILGCLYEDVNISSEINLEKFVIFQGSRDPYGAIEQVKSKFNNAEVIVVENGDHSFRNELKEPIYESFVVNSLIEKISHIL